MPDIDTIRKQLADTALYHGMSYAAIVGVAAEIEAVEDKAQRAALRREFKAYHSLTAQVWARVSEWFSQYDLCKLSAQAIRAMAYCCQLKKDECYAVYNAHLDHVEEPGALGLVLRDVNSFFDARRTSNGTKRATNDATADRMVIISDYYHEHRNDYITAHDAISDFLADVDADPAVASVLAKRGKAETK